MGDLAIYLDGLSASAKSARAELAGLRSDLEKTVQTAAAAEKAVEGSVRGIVNTTGTVSGGGGNTGGVGSSSSLEEVISELKTIEGRG